MKEWLRNRLYSAFERYISLFLSVYIDAKDETVGEKQTLSREAFLRKRIQSYCISLGFFNFARK